MRRIQRVAPALRPSSALNTPRPRLQCLSAAPFSTSAAKAGITDTLRSKMFKPAPKEEQKRGLVEDENYVPAKDGRGLRVVGLVDPVKDTEWVLESFKPAVKNMQQPSPLKLFKATKRAYLEHLAAELYPQLAKATPAAVEDLTAAIEAEQTAAVPETDTEGNAQMEVQEVTKAEMEGIMGETAKNAFFVETGTAQSFVDEVQLQPTSDGGVKVDWSSQEAIQSIAQGSLETVSGIVDLRKLDKSEIPGQLPSTPEVEAFARIILTPTQKFALHARLLQLTGLTIPDAALANAKTLLHLVEALIPPPPRKKLHLAETTPVLAEAENVRIHVNRVSPVKWEKERGRLHVSLARGLEIRERREKGDVYRYAFEKGVGTPKVKGMQNYLQ